MSNYSDALGFVPSTVDENLQKLKNTIQTVLGFTYATDLDFTSSNIYNLLIGSANQKTDLENNLVQIINAFFEWIGDTQNSIQFSESASLKGLSKAFLSSFKGVNFSSSVDDSSIDPGIALVAIDNSSDTDTIAPFTTEELEKIKDIFLNYWPIGIQTFKDVSNLPAFSVEVEHTKNITRTYYFDQVVLTKLWVQIEYRALDNAVIPGGENQILIDAFLKSFYAVNMIGLDFEPRRYLSTQNVEWVAEIQVKWKKNESDPSYTSGKLDTDSFKEKFVLARNEQGQEIIEVVAIND